MNAHVPAGHSSLTPLLVLHRAAEAIAFYTDVLGARPVVRMDGPDGTVVHCDLDLGAGRFTVMSPSEEYHTRAPDPDDDTVSSSLGVFVPDVDATTRLAAERGATVREQPTDFVNGVRFASIRDPFGVRWTLMTQVEPKTDAEVQAALDAWAASWA
ncbi:VOC family protein [Desertihabitans aurantiacus]|uniref:VOC family protein n=1 Tax=Desertihabitans aurantiacus TaxID=2282477 RepID=UPI000DF79EAC|nr:VOC family protein [Desertihabitans aurantiacus]